MPIHKEFNKNFFKKWSRGMAYILGFLYADGNILKSKRNTYFTAFYTADYGLIHSIRKSIESNHKIAWRGKDNGGAYSLQIGSRELFEDLCELGLTPNKARRMKLPKIPTRYVGDFIRGYFDGDGCVWTGVGHKNRKTKTSIMLVIFTSASMEFLSDLNNELSSMGLLGGSLFKSKDGNFGRLQYSTLDALKLYKIMYNKDCKLFLRRKRVIFEDFIKMRL